MPVGAAEMKRAHDYCDLLALAFMPAALVAALAACGLIGLALLWEWKWAKNSDE